MEAFVRIGRIGSHLGPIPELALGARLASTWAQAGPLYTEHMVFSGRGLDDPPAHGHKLAVVLHGLLGVGRNLRSVTNSLFSAVAQTSGATWTAVLVDLRNHGKSTGLPGLDPPHTLTTAARDVIDTVANNWGGGIDCLAGHSFGGKVSLEVTRQLAQVGAPFSPPKQVWVLDAAPGRVDPSSSGVSADVLHVLESVAAVPLPIPSREWLYAHLEEKGFGKTMQQWLGSNIVAVGKGQYVWAFNLQGATDMFRSYLGTEFWDLLRHPPRGTTINLVRAERSDRWDGESMQELAAAAKASEHDGGRDGGVTKELILESAGHWVHTDNPKGLVNLMAPSLAELS